MRSSTTFRGDPVLDQFTPPSRRYRDPDVSSIETRVSSILSNNLSDIQIYTY